MKVIYAGYSKTGTKSMTAAFMELNYKTFDWLENSYYLGKDWRRILKEGGTVEDFRRMYEGVDAVVDAPCNLFWKELLEAFPEAKIVFAMRDEETLVKSLMNQIRTAENNTMYTIMQMLSLSGWNHFTFTESTLQLLISAKRNWPWSKFQLSPLVIGRNYRTHNAYLLQNAPKDKLLIFNVKEGWEPLCEFLGEKVPNKPFPHANIGASLIKDYMENHPIMIRMMRETMFSLGVLTLIGAYGGYKVYQNPASIRGWINAAMTKFKFW
ncbi:uncharacterized protein LOC108950450 [Ciona intestinalis]